MIQESDDTIINFEGEVFAWNWKDYPDGPTEEDQIGWEKVERKDDD